MLFASVKLGEKQILLGIMKRHFIDLSIWFFVLTVWQTKQKCYEIHFTSVSKYNQLNSSKYQFLFVQENSFFFFPFHFSVWNLKFCMIRDFLFIIVGDTLSMRALSPATKNFFLRDNLFA